MSTGQPIDEQASLEHEPELNKFFKAAIKTRASDLHLKVGQPPKLRLYGELKKTTGEVMTVQRIKELVFEILSSAQQDFFLEHGTLDFAHEIEGEHRFRTNIFRSYGLRQNHTTRIDDRPHQPNSLLPYNYDRRPYRVSV